MATTTEPGLTKVGNYEFPVLIGLAPPRIAEQGVPTLACPESRFVLNNGIQRHL